MFITNKVKFEDLPSYEIGMETGILALYKITGDISLIKKN